MSHYLHNWKLKPNQDPLKLPQEYDIFYSKEPNMIYDFIELAVADCKIVNDMHVKYRDSYCQFEVEKLSENKFTIICKSHPDECV